MCKIWRGNYRRYTLLTNPHCHQEGQENRQKRCLQSEVPPFSFLCWSPSSLYRMILWASFVPDHGHKPTSSCHPVTRRWSFAEDQAIAQDTAMVFPQTSELSLRDHETGQWHLFPGSVLEGGDAAYQESDCKYLLGSFEVGDLGWWLWALLRQYLILTYLPLQHSPSVWLDLWKSV